MENRKTKQMVINEALMELLKAMMTTEGIKGNDLAKKLGLSEPNISMWLNCRKEMRVSSFFLILSAMNYRPEFIKKAPEDEGVNTIIRDFIINPPDTSISDN